VARKAIKKRADLLLVEKGLADTRERAQALIMEGLVYTPAGKVLKPGSPTATDTSLEVRGGLPYVSRGGVKLAHALDRFGLDVSGLVALDVGASTGGFTDCLLQRGARKVSALDVGHGQMDYRLRQDPRVVVIERVNARYPFSLAAPEADRRGPGRTASDTASSEEDEEVVDLATVDVSFISAARIMSSVAQHVKRGGFIILLIKPQFEAGRDEVGRGGVIKDPRVHAGVLARAILWVVEAGFRLRDLTPSPILGDAGNREFFLLLQK
jgi:23S rRNA (cytidine1920-2'-O)/16S rRNA (cytidine1409-2'-O)-methyltransferase